MSSINPVKLETILKSTVLNKYLLVDQATKIIRFIDIDTELTQKSFKERDISIIRTTKIIQVFNELVYIIESIPECSLKGELKSELRSLYSLFDQAKEYRTTEEKKLNDEVKAITEQGTRVITNIDTLIRVIKIGFRINHLTFDDDGSKQVHYSRHDLYELFGAFNPTPLPEQLHFSLNQFAKYGEIFIFLIQYAIDCGRLVSPHITIDCTHLKPISYDEPKESKDLKELAKKIISIGNSKKSVNIHLINTENFELLNYCTGSFDNTGLNFTVSGTVNDKSVPWIEFPQRYWFSPGRRDIRLDIYQQRRKIQNSALACLAFLQRAYHSNLSKDVTKMIMEKVLTESLIPKHLITDCIRKIYRIYELCQKRNDPSYWPKFEIKYAEWPERNYKSIEVRKYRSYGNFDIILFIRTMIRDQGICYIKVIGNQKDIYIGQKDISQEEFNLANLLTPAEIKESFFVNGLKYGIEMQPPYKTPLLEPLF